VGEAHTVIANAGPIARGIVPRDCGLDMEVEFKDDNHQPTGQRVWLQRESGDSHPVTANATTATSSGSTNATPCVSRWGQNALDVPTGHHGRSALSQQIR
jgi:hypothetical protein